MLNDFLYRLYLVDRDRILAEGEEVADEDRLLLVVDKMSVFLEQLVVALAGGKLQSGYSLRIPGMLDAVLTIVELSHAGQEVELLGGEGLVVQQDGVAGDGLKTNTADGAYLCSEIVLQQTLAQTDALEDLGSAIAADGGDSHLGHNLEQAFLHSLDVVLFGCVIVFLYLALLYQVVEDGVGEVRAEC